MCVAAYEKGLPRTAMSDFYQTSNIIIGALVLTQGIIFCGLLCAEGWRALRANRWMILFVVAVCTSLSQDVLRGAGYREIAYYGTIIFETCNYAIAPAIYLYFREISGQRHIHAGRYLFHLAIIANLVFWLLVGTEGVSPDGKISVEWATSHGPLMAAVYHIVEFGLYVQATVFLWLSIRVASRYLRQMHKQFGADRDRIVRWVAGVLGSLVLIFVLFVATEAPSDFWNGAEPAFPYLNLAFLLVFFFLSYILVCHPVVFVLRDWEEERDELYGRPAPMAVPTAQEAEVDKADSNSDTGPGPDIANLVAPASSVVAIGPEVSPDTIERPLVADADAARFVRRLEVVRAEGTVLHDPMISLPRLARAVGATPNQLSYVLNHHLGQNFFDFVNRARIAEAVRMLIAEPDKGILDIALDVGFNSKSTFNLAFKNITGETPSARRRRGLVASE
jgi:AraC-like DNA-binding protein